jgi:hypothetical protein
MVTDVSEEHHTCTFWIAQCKKFLTLFRKMIYIFLVHRVGAVHISLLLKNAAFCTMEHGIKASLYICTN